MRNAVFSSFFGGKNKKSFSNAPTLVSCVVVSPMSKSRSSKKATRVSLFVTSPSLRRSSSGGAWFISAAEVGACSSSYGRIASGSRTTSVVMRRRLRKLSTTSPLAQRSAASLSEVEGAVTASPKVDMLVAASLPLLPPYFTFTQCALSHSCRSWSAFAPSAPAAPAAPEASVAFCISFCSFFSSFFRSNCAPRTKSKKFFSRKGTFSIADPFATSQVTQPTTRFPGNCMRTRLFSSADGRSTTIPWY
mmetsp:Transcript_13459/g.33013  ORF Transcript_13459/g.33013 Transcript_13459/m.33013 type:complete len:248 (+) Transcript_13459:919-1662(+)